MKTISGVFTLTASVDGKTPRPNLLSNGDVVLLRSVVGSDMFNGRNIIIGYRQLVADRGIVGGYCNVSFDLEWLNMKVDTSASSQVLRLLLFDNPSSKTLLTHTLDLSAHPSGSAHVSKLISGIKATSVGIYEMFFNLSGVKLNNVYSFFLIRNIKIEKVPEQEAVSGTDCETTYIPSAYDMQRPTAPNVIPFTETGKDAGGVAKWTSTFDGLMLNRDDFQLHNITHEEKYFYGPEVELRKDEFYVISFEAKYTGTKPASCQFHLLQKKSPYKNFINHEFQPTTVWQKFSIKGDARYLLNRQEKDDVVQIRFDHNGVPVPPPPSPTETPPPPVTESVLHIRRVKMEIGVYDTPWHPALSEMAGPQGASLQFPPWEEHQFYLSGKNGEPYLHIVKFKTDDMGKPIYYQCMKTIAEESKLGVNDPLTSKNQHLGIWEVTHKYDTILADRIAAWRIDTDELVVNSLYCVSPDGTVIRIMNGVEEIFDSVESTHPTMRFGKSNGRSVLQYFDTDGTLLYDLGPEGVMKLDTPQMIDIFLCKVSDANGLTSMIVSPQKHHYYRYQEGTIPAPGFHNRIYTTPNLNSDKRPMGNIISDGVYTDDFSTPRVQVLSQRPALYYGDRFVPNEKYYCRDVITISSGRISGARQKAYWKDSLKTDY